MQSKDVKIWTGNLALCAAAILALGGCAIYQGTGNAPTAEEGTAQSARTGEFYKTETLPPGVGSALFPDPAWR
jgi:hypothetical protein